MTITWEYQEQSDAVKIEKGDVTIGRTASEGEQPDVILDFDERISRMHARIWIEDDDYWLADLGSARGTSVNGRELDEDEAWGLTEMDVIQIGETTIRVTGLKCFKTMVLRPPLESGD
jgi:predicted component of type VI protein secretion system